MLWWHILVSCVIKINGTDKFNAAKTEHFHRVLLTFTMQLSNTLYQLYTVPEPLRMIPLDLICVNASFIDVILIFPGFRLVGHWIIQLRCNRCDCYQSIIYCLPNIKQNSSRIIRIQNITAYHITHTVIMGSFVHIWFGGRVLLNRDWDCNAAYHCIGWLHCLNILTLSI